MAEKLWFISDDSLIDTFEGEKEVKNLKVGDLLFDEKNQENKIICIVRSFSFTENFVNFGKFRVIYSCPVKEQGNSWKYAEKIFASSHYYGPISVLITEKNILTSNYLIGVLGNSEQKEIIGHPYLSTQESISDLKKYGEWNSGYISIDDSHIKFGIPKSYGTVRMITKISCDQ